MARSAATPTTARELWPIFICYRQVDGLAPAQRLHELLDKYVVAGPDGHDIQFDVYLDQTMPAVADWQEIHRPYLKRARAFIVVCTPGAKIKDGPGDWVHKEIGWWLQHRMTVPILVDPLRQGTRYIPTAIGKRWPKIQRIHLVESEWADLSPQRLEQKVRALRLQVVGNILPSGAAIYQEELKAERRRAAKLRLALRDAEISRRVSEASLHDAKAASMLEEARRYEARWEAERQRKIENSRALVGLPFDDDDAAKLRKQNLAFENRQLDESLKALAAKAAGPRQQGYFELKSADEAWNALEREGQSIASRKPPEPPYIFSVELISAGSGHGECILIHYGPPDATRIVMVNGGTGAAFEKSVGTRLRSLRTERFADAPIPIELFVASDQDENKTGGLLRMLRQQAGAADAKDHLVELRLVWADMFASSGIRGQIRRLLEDLRVPLNAPFDHLVMRPERGRLVHKLPDGLEIVVLGPERSRLAELFADSRKNDRRHGSPRDMLVREITSFPDERLSRLEVSDGGDCLPQTPATMQDGRCAPSKNARSRAQVANLDTSVANLASTVLLFRYRGKTFLHTGDSRADLIMDGLSASGLIGSDGSAHVDLLLMPHLGSNRNLSPEFLERVTADEYLFTADGSRFGFSVETVAALIAARPCAEYTMHLVSRDSPVRGHWQAAAQGKETDRAGSLDSFFAAEEEYSPRYRRNFQSSDQGSVVIDLLDRLTY